MTEHTVAGRSVRRPDLVDKVTGAATFCVDISVSGMLHGKVVRGDRAHARIVHIEAASARAMPGVTAVVTGVDLDGLFPRFGHIVPDHFILAIDRIRYYGEPVALVLAETPAQAADAAEFVRVAYEDMPVMVSAAEALAPGATPIHDQTYDTSGDDSFELLTGRQHETATPGADELTNVAHEVSLEWGDVGGALAGADTVVENAVHFPALYAYAMEPYNAVASYERSGLDVRTTAQHPYMVRDDLCRIFGLPLSRVTVGSPYVGGGYGSKSYTKVEPLAAIGSWYTGRPVKLVLDVEESIYTTRADSADIWVRSGFDSSGRVLAREFDITLNSGAYVDNSPLVLAKAVNRCFGPYRVPNLRVHGRAVYTNTSPASSYRGFGAPQGNLAGETNMDRAAAQLGIDPAEIRRINLVDKGAELLPGKRGMDADLKDDLELAVKALQQNSTDAPFTGVGVGCSASDAGAFPVSTASVRVQFDGSVSVFSGSTEMGQGSSSVLAQLAAQELGVPLDQVNVVQSDSTVTPYERTTGASRTTALVGLALQGACADARQKIRGMAAEVADTSTESIQDIPGGVRCPDRGEYTFGEVITRWFGAQAGEVTGLGAIRKEGELARLPPFWEIGMVGVSVELDPETGVVEVDQLVTVGDVGFAMNPKAVEGQDLGAATQGLGAALYEELIYDGPQLVNANVVDYRVPRVTDMPRRIENLLVQRRDGVGPYGAKGAGEGALNPVGSAMAAAVAKASGYWPARLPLTPERVWRLVNRIPEDDL